MWLTSTGLNLRAFEWTGSCCACSGSKSLSIERGCPTQHQHLDIYLFADPENCVLLSRPEDPGQQHCDDRTDELEKGILYAYTVSQVCT